MIRKFYLCTTSFNFSSGLTVDDIAVSNTRYSIYNSAYPKNLTLRRTEYIFNDIGIAKEDFKILNQKRVR